MICSGLIYTFIVHIVTIIILMLLFNVIVSLVTLVLNSAHGTRTISIGDNRIYQSCRRCWCRVTLHVLTRNVLLVTATVTVVIVQPITLKQSYSHPVIGRLTVSVHPLTNIHFVHSVHIQSSSQSTTPPQNYLSRSTKLIYVIFRSI